MPSINNKDNPMPLMHFVVVIFKSNLSNLGIRLVTAFGLGLTLVQAVFFCSRDAFDINSLFSFICYVYVRLITICWLSIVYLMDISGVLEAYQRLSWPLDSVGSESGRRLSRRAAIEDRKAFLVFLAYLVSVGHLLLDWNRLENSDFVIVSLRRHFSDDFHFELIYLSVLIGWGLVTLPASLAFPFAFYYFNWRQQIQTVLLAEYVREVFVGKMRRCRFGRQDGNRVKDRVYQKEIWQRLRFVVKRHGQLLKIFQVRMDFLAIKQTGLLFGSSGGLMAMACSYNLVIGNKLPMSLCILALVTLLLEMMTGATQGYEDSHEELFDSILMMPWDDWDVTNRRAYSLLVQQTAQLVPYKFLNVRVNRAFQIKFIEKIYGVGALFMKLNQ